MLFYIYLQKKQPPALKFTFGVFFVDPPLQHVLLVQYQFFLHHNISYTLHTTANGKTTPNSKKVVPDLLMVKDKTINCL